MTRNEPNKSYKEIPIPPIPPIDPQEAERRSAAARAYALQSTKVVLPMNHRKRKSTSPLFTHSHASTVSRHGVGGSGGGGISMKPPNGSHAGSITMAGAATMGGGVASSSMNNLEDDEYAKFVQSLLREEDSLPPTMKETEEEDDQEYKSSDESMEGNESMDTSHCTTTAPPLGNSSTPPSSSALDDAPLDDFGDLDWEFDLDPMALEAELGALLEEELEAAESTLLKGGDPVALPPNNKDVRSIPSDAKCANNSTITSATAPTEESNLSSCSRSTVVQAPVPPTAAQMTQLKTLMAHHYQLLLQQSILSVRAAHGNKFRHDPNPSPAVPLDTTMTTTTTTSGGVEGGAGVVAGGPGPGTRKLYKFNSKRRKESNFFMGGETQDDLGDILDGAVTMLQDLDQNRKDAIRHFIQMKRLQRSKSRCTSHHHARNGTGGCGGGISSGSGSGSGSGGASGGLYPVNAPTAARSILVDPEEEEEEDSTKIETDESYGRKWLTRSAFQMLQLENGGSPSKPNKDERQSENWSGLKSTNSNYAQCTSNTSFGVKGLARLKDSFAVIDNSLNANTAGGMIDSAGIDMDGINVLEQANHGHACKLLLEHVGADYDKSLIPGELDLLEILTNPSEVFGVSVEGEKKTTPQQQMQLRKNRGQFTAAEDNLLLRGVNLYGEKEWSLISDRYLPDRNASNISQRYWRLCLLIYRGNHVCIDGEGNLKEAPKYENGADDFDEKLIAENLFPVTPPITYNLYRWSLQEDLMLLKAVPIMGKMFAEIKKRFIPHRDRGALRKRYQVLERRVKGTLRKEKKTPPLDCGASKQRVGSQGRVKPAKKRKPSMPLPLPATSGDIRPPHGFLLAAQSGIIQADRGNKIFPVPYKKAFNPYPPGKGGLPVSVLSTGMSVTSTKSRISGTVDANGPITLSDGKAFPPVSDSFQPFNQSPGSSSNILNPAPHTGLSTRKTDVNISNSADGSSRMHFESLINGEWSQMSNFRKIINDDGESRKVPVVKDEEVDKKQSNSASHPGAQYNERLPNMTFDDSYSGFSMLNSSTFSQQGVQNNEESKTNKRHESIMSTVLGRSRTGAPQHPLPSNPPKKRELFQNTKGEAPPVPNSLDAFTFSNMSFSGDSRQMLDRDSETQSKGAGLSNINFSRPFSSGGNSTNMYNNAMNSLLLPPEFTAISALNQMSNSSVPFSMTTTKKESKEEDKNKSATGSKKSLFQQVVGKR